jgi:hypothetical protein
VEAFRPLVSPTRRHADTPIRLFGCGYAALVVSSEKGAHVISNDIKAQSARFLPHKRPGNRAHKRSLSCLGVPGQKVLLIVPDATRTCPLGSMRFRLPTELSSAKSATIGTIF